MKDYTQEAKEFLNKERITYKYINRDSLTDDMALLPKLLSDFASHLSNQEEERFDTIREVLTIVLKKRRDYGRLARKAKNDSSLVHQDTIYRKNHNHWIAYNDVVGILKELLSEANSSQPPKPKQP